MFYEFRKQYLSFYTAQNSIRIELINHKPLRQKKSCDMEKVTQIRSVLDKDQP